MYDDPGSSPAAVYDNGPPEVDDGLYDEPAFTQQVRAAIYMLFPPNIFRCCFS